MQASEEIKQKLDIVDVIREYIQLKPAGVNFRAPCPFHNEKSPSFVVSPEKQIWHCFGCGKGGDLFSFIMEHEGLNFSEVLRILAPKAGVTLKQYDPKMSSQRNRLLDILDLSRKFYYEKLINSPIAQNARDYLKMRGLSEAEIDEWQIGYSPDSWDDLLNYLKSKGFRDPEIMLSGMIIKKEGTNRFYNRFRSRVMFPINDINGNPVGFSARITPEKEEQEKMGKYINSPQTLIYDKSKVLFGLDKAKQEIKKKTEVIIVEGQMDVVTAHQHGFKNVVAQSGTALTKEQIKLINRYTSNLTFALDFDKAGQMATGKGDDVIKDFDYAEVKGQDRFGRVKNYIDPLLSHNINIKVIEVPNGKDPDECIRNNPKDWELAVNNAKPIMQYYFDSIFSSIDSTSIENRRKIAQKLLPKIAKIGNAIEKDYWIKVLSEKLDVGENSLRETINNSIKNKKVYTSDLPEKKEKKQEIPKSREEMLSELFLALIIKFPKLIDITVDNVYIDHIANQEYKKFYKNIILYYNDVRVGEVAPENFDYKELRSWIEKRVEEINKTSIDQLKYLHLLDRLVLLGDENFYKFDLEKARDEIYKIGKELKTYYFNNRKKEIEKMIFEAEKQKDNAQVMELMKDLKILNEESQKI